MKKVYRTLIVSVLLLMFVMTTYAQQSVITGTVKDAAGTPMPGVNVLIRGTTIGTSTDANGKFSLQASEEAVLVISFIGYQSQEITVGGRTTIDVILEEDLLTLGEVVVVGYGVQKKALNTGANLQVEGESLQRLSTTNALQALQGQAPGVQISSMSGQPGEPLRVVVRGLGTIGNAGPLYVVDGVLTNDINYLNPADIESVTVLKDAASAAIYGSQAANGVVLVTTKSGKSGRNAQLTFDAYYGVQNVARKVDMLNAREYAHIMNEAIVNSGKLPFFSEEEIAAMGAGTDWIDEMFVSDALTQNYSLGASGGSDFSVYSTSLSYLSQEGIVGGKDLSNYERYNFRINSEHKLYGDVVTVGQHLNFAFVNNNGIGVGNQYNNSLRGAFNTSPLIPMYDDEGNFYNTTDDENTLTQGTQANPYAEMVYNNQNRRNNQRLIGDIYLQVEPVKNLKLRSSLGVDYFVEESRDFRPQYRLSTYSFYDFRRVDQYMAKGNTLIWDNLASYSFEVNAAHQFEVMLGTSAYQYNRSGIWGNNIGLVFSDLDHAWLSNATNTNGTNITIGGGPTDRPGANGPTIFEEQRLSYFGRINYNFNETYLLNVTFRADGSSKFAPGNQWGYFPSVSAGWNITNESFMEDVTWLNNLKLRASWGQVGNQNITAFQYMAPISFSNTNYIFGPGEGSDGLVAGAYQSRLGNPDLVWETSEQLNIGFDAQLLSGRLTVNFDWYDKQTKDWLILAPLLATSGTENLFINGGSVTNRGIELALSFNNSVGELNYTVGVNGAYNKNTAGTIPTPDGIIHGAPNQLFDNSLEFYRAQSGYPIGYFWGLQTNGIFQTEEEVLNHRSSEGVLIQPNARPGDVRYVDRDDNGVINDQDKTEIGNPNPDLTFGITMSFDYKGFDLSILANGVAGNELVQSYRNHANPYNNYTTAILDRWHGPGSSNTMPRVTEDNRNWINFSDLYIHDGSFLRISNITFGYDFTKHMSKKFVNQLRLYASVLNLYTFTKYEGMDPEIGYGIDNGERDRFSQGIDLGYYPRPRTFMLGVNVKF